MGSRLGLGLGFRTQGFWDLGFRFPGFMVFGIEGLGLSFKI